MKMETIGMTSYYLMVFSMVLYSIIIISAAIYKKGFEAGVKSVYDHQSDLRRQQKDGESILDYWEKQPMTQKKKKPEHY